MKVSFAVLLDKDIKNLVDTSRKYFNIDYFRESKDQITLIDEQDSCIIKISPRKIKFIINSDDVDFKLQKINNLIKDNLSNEDIGIKYYSGDSKKLIDVINNENVIYI